MQEDQAKGLAAFLMSYVLHADVRSAEVSVNRDDGVVLVFIDGRKVHQSSLDEMKREVVEVFK